MEVMVDPLVQVGEMRAATSRASALARRPGNSPPERNGDHGYAVAFGVATGTMSFHAV
jgi:hypothetical protein